METMLQRARQAIEIALEKSKEQARDLAAEAGKRADQIRDLALDSAGKMKVSIGAVSSPSDALPTEEYERYGITPELRDFVQGLTIDTFRDFPMEDQELNGRSRDDTFDGLSPWKERHALLVLFAVPEISEFRYKLCPKHIKERRFWRIYFALVDGHIAKYNATSSADSGGDGHEHKTKDNVRSPPSLPATKDETIPNDEDLDNYLLAALGESDEDNECLGEDDENLDAEFAQLVKDAEMDSDTEISGRG